MPNQHLNYIHGEQIIPAEENPPRRYRKGRRCKAAKCKTKLNQYNPTEFCSIHNESDKWGIFVKGKRRANNT